ncbi:3421_t:CDS:10 [Diversispora eburnea]|uniref:Kinesin-like protein n=1 Tax=Diversispora eburnea TaxID=1213867 RepID=A0A9N9FA59_9GLOM|nr:3421_t:CDS:10 [Diversispora eburnea]
MNRTLTKSPAFTNTLAVPNVSDVRSRTPDPSKLNSSNSTDSNNANNVKVTIRVRPPNDIELSRGENEIWNVDNNQHKVSLDLDFIEKSRRQPIEYNFDAVFSGSDNKLLFENGVKDTVSSVMEGYNGTKKRPGVIPQAVDAVFQYIKMCKEKQFLLRVSYLEIYNETVRDLLSPETEDLRIHEDKHRGVYVSPLKEVLVSTPDQVMREIKRGEANRHMSATDWNERSKSASKGLLPFKPKRYSSSPKGSGVVYSSVLNLIDLAGSEKAASSADRRKEGAFINKSLLTLATVISKLTEKNIGYIPYRDSKLTRILQNSLSGNAKVAVICTISPSIINLEESNNTLKFAARVKKVVTRAHTNEIVDDKALLQKYRLEIEELKAKLEKTNAVNDQEKEAELSKKLEIEKAKHEEEMLEAQLIRTALKERIDHLTKLILTNSSFNNGAQLNDSDADGPETQNNNKMELEQKNRIIAEKDQVIAQKDKVIEELTAQLNNFLYNNTKEDNNVLNYKLQEKDDEISDLRKLNNELENIIKRQKQKIYMLESH